MAQGREVEDEIHMLAVEFGTRLGGGEKQLFGDERRNAKLVYDVLHFVAARRL